MCGITGFDRRSDWFHSFLSASCEHNADVNRSGKEKEGDKDEIQNDQKSLDKKGDSEDAEN